MRTNIIRHFFSKTKPLKISAISTNQGLQAKSQTANSAWQVANPLETLLSSLAACQLSTLRAFTGKSQIKIKKVTFTKVESGLDIANFMKGGKDSKLNEIFIQAKIEMNGTQQQLNDLMKKVQHSCPVYQMLTQSGVKINSKYQLLQ